MDGNRLNDDMTLGGGGGGEGGVVVCCQVCIERGQDNQPGGSNGVKHFGIVTLLIATTKFFVHIQRRRSMNLLLHSQLKYCEISNANGNQIYFS